MSLHQQGANKGAVTSFLISTPESGADSIAITYALLDPVMTVVRPVAAFLTALTAGIIENLTGSKNGGMRSMAASSSPNGVGKRLESPPALTPPGPRLGAKLVNELRYAFTGFWDDMAGSFFVGIILAGIISALIPESFFRTYLGGGFSAMLIMLVAGIPLYICATASTPIAAALILKGVSPGAALVFLLAGPATNAAAVLIILRTLGKKSTAIYLVSIAACALLFGLLVDGFYMVSGLSARAVAGEAAEAIPHWLAVASTVILLLLSLRSLWQKLPRRTKTAVDPASSSSPGVSIMPNSNAADRPPEGPA